MANANGLSPAMEKLHKQLLDIQTRIQPAITEQMLSIDLEHLFTPIYEAQSKFVQSNISFAIDQLVEKIQQVNHEIQPIISNITFSSTELANKFAELHPYLEEQLINIKDLHYDDFSDEEVQEFEEITTNLNQISEIIKSKKLTVEAWLAIVGIIIAIFAMYQSHIYHVEDSESDEQFQTQVIQLFQEIADSCCESVENHHETIENTQVPTDEN